jgi:hypothetical protein
MEINPIICRTLSKFLYLFNLNTSVPDKYQIVDVVVVNNVMWAEGVGKG